MEKPLVSVNIITFNGERYIKKCLESVAGQTYKNIEVNVLDNNSKDNTLKIIEESLSSLKNRKLQATNYKLQANIGFAKGHNILIEKSRGAYIVMLNQDAWLDRAYIERSIDVFKKNDRIGALQPKIYRYDFGNDKVVKKDGKPIIDATGLVILKNRRVIARGQGQRDQGQFDSQEAIFGADGAAPMFNRSVLEDIKIPTANSYEYLDESFFMYKEDVDLSWRLRLAGWNIVYVPLIVAYHERGSGESATTTYRGIFKERKQISKLAKSLSWRNQRLMQVKNEIPFLYLKHLPYILVKEILSLGYILLFERYALQSIREFFLLLPDAWQKRQIIQSGRRKGSREMAQWFQ